MVGDVGRLQGVGWQNGVVVAVVEWGVVEQGGGVGWGGMVIVGVGVGAE